MNYLQKNISSVINICLLIGVLGFIMTGCGGSGGTDSGPGPGPNPNPPQGQSFDSGNIAPGASYSFTFDETGAFDYICTIHAGMNGTVTVESGAEISGEFTISIDNLAFSPSEVTVSPGTEITWVNNDDVTHTATSD